MSDLIADGTGTVTTAGTRVALSATSLKMLSVALRAADTNGGTVVVGAVTVVAAASTRRGFPLKPGESIALNGGHSGDGGAIDLADVYIDSTADGDKVTYLALGR